MSELNLIERLRAADPIGELPSVDPSTDPHAVALFQRIVATQDRAVLHPRRRARTLMPAGLATVAAGAVVATTLSAGASTELPVVTTGAAHTALIAAAQRADGTDVERPKANYRKAAEGAVVNHHVHRGHEYTLLLSYPITTKVGSDPDEGLTTYGHIKATPLTPQDAEAYRADGSPAVDSGPDAPISPPDLELLPAFDEGAIFEGDVTTMPTDPIALREAMLDWVADVGEWWTHLPGLSQRPKDPAAWLFREGTKLLDNHYWLSPARRASIYTMMAELPGVRTLSGTDPLGRPAVSLAISEKTDKYGTMEWQLFLDPTKDHVLGVQSVVSEPGAKNSDLKAGTVFSRYVVRSSGYAR
jgi:hypothetical protein